MNTMMFQYAIASLLYGFVLLSNSMIAPSGAFSLVEHQRATVSKGMSSRLYAESSTSNGNKNDDDNKMGMFESEGWKNIAGDLQTFPLFSVATAAEGNPIAYQITVKEKTFNIPFFFCDVTEGLVELEKAQANSAKVTQQVQGKGGERQEKELKLIPFSLGQAFPLWCDDKAVIIPSKASILQAGAPAGTNPIGQKVPMWACLDISEEQEGGLPPKLPIFMCLDDANAAVKEATTATEGEKTNEDKFEVVCLSLDAAIEQLVTEPEESPSFHFIPPSKSLKYIEENIIEEDNNIKESIDEKP